MLLGGLAGVTLPLAAKDPVPTPVPQTEFVWSDPDEASFGGFSAIEMEADGGKFIALSDSGAYVEAFVRRDPAGAITGLEATTAMTDLLDARGKPLRDAEDDSEGLAILPDGSAFVSFEGPARVLRYDRIDGVPTPLPVPGEFRAMQVNSALEALAATPDGVLYTLPERSGRIEQPFPVYRFRNGVWDQPFDLPRDGTLLPVGADIGPDGRLYVLEREFLGLAGFRMRLRSFQPGDAALTDERVVVETTTGRHGNLEGVSLWRNAAGHLIATMIADNNYRWYLPTEIVEYDLGPSGAGSAGTLDRAAAQP